MHRRVNYLLANSNVETNKSSISKYSPKQTTIVTGSLPFIKVPLHTLFKVTPAAYTRNEVIEISW